MHSVGCTSDFWLVAVRNVLDLLKKALPLHRKRSIPHAPRMLEWWNGRHEGLKILWSLRPCGFESRFEHRHPSVKPSQTASRTDFSFTNCPDFLQCSSGGCGLILCPTSSTPALVGMPFDPTPPSHRRTKNFPFGQFFCLAFARSWWGYESITASRFSG